ncbi:MAG: hypothetical protein J3Q66DRAFT_398083 [Benniella sp.]|nr:MAG: hypothetical protein J3Q66DRAFT_398083 [Benniella sp.]
MNTRPSLRKPAFLLTNEPSEWGDLEAYIIQCKESNRDYSSYPPEKFVKLYTASLDHIINDETSTAEEKSMAETLKASDLLSNMRNALDSIKTTHPQETHTALKRKHGVAPKIEEPWLGLIVFLMAKVKGESQRALIRTDETLSDNHRMLYDFVFGRLSQPEQLSKLSEYDVYIALSGIINARMKNSNKYFGEKILNTIKMKCRRDEFHRPEHVPGLNDVLEKLKGMPGRFISPRGVVDYDGLVQEATYLKAKYIKKIKKKNTLPDPIYTAVLQTVDYLARARPSASMYEAKVVSIWEHVLYYLSNEALDLIPGEIPSRATKHQSTCLGLELNIEMSKGSGGKRLDLQCRAEDLEVNNSEFKRCGATQGKLEQQLPKNLLINHSMMLYLKEKIDFPLDEYELQALDVHVTHHAPELPHCATTWKHFLEGETITILWNYVSHLIKVAEHVRRQKAKHGRENAVAYQRTRDNCEPKTLGEFTCLCPTKPRSASEVNSESTL